MASANLGARIVHWSDKEHANKPNILLDDGRKEDEGWLTPRSRGSSRNDFVVIQLAETCVVEGIVLDTTGFKGNFPEYVLIEGCQSNLVSPNNNNNNNNKCVRLNHLPKGGSLQRPRHSMV